LFAVANQMPLVNQLPINCVHLSSKQDGFSLAGLNQRNVQLEFAEFRALSRLKNGTTKPTLLARIVAA
jgi:hypothetical protein